MTTAVLMLLVVAIPASAHAEAAAHHRHAPPCLGGGRQRISAVGAVRPAARGPSRRSPTGVARRLFRVAEEAFLPDPVWSSRTDDALMRETIAVLERRNVIGVLSGPPERGNHDRARLCRTRRGPCVAVAVGRDQVKADVKHRPPYPTCVFRRDLRNGEPAR
jgi:hypothetical protein